MMCRCPHLIYMLIHVDLPKLWTDFWALFDRPDPTRDYIARLKAAERFREQGMEDVPAHLKSLAIKKYYADMALFLFKLGTTGFLVFQGARLIVDAAGRILTLLFEFLQQIAPAIGVLLTVAMIIAAWEVLAHRLLPAKGRAALAERLGLRPADEGETDRT